MQNAARDVANQAELQRLKTHTEREEGLAKECTACELTPSPNSMESHDSNVMESLVVAPMPPPPGLVRGCRPTPPRDPPGGMHKTWPTSWI